MKTYKQSGSLHPFILAGNRGGKSSFVALRVTSLAPNNTLITPPIPLREKCFTAAAMGVSRISDLTDQAGNQADSSVKKKLCGSLNNQMIGGDITPNFNNSECDSKCLPGVLESKHTESCLDEYEEWANSESNGSLYGEVNALSGDATNVHHPANQKTCRRGSKMYENDTSTPDSGVPPTLKNHSAFKSDDVIHTTSQYILEPLERAQYSGRRSIAVKADMKSGKTYAIAKQIRDQPENTITIVVIASQTLSQSTAVRLAELSGKNVVDYQNINASALPNAVVTTFNSLPIVEKKLGESVVIHRLVFDEVEQGAQFMARGTISNKSQAADSIRRLARKAAFVTVMDAHLGANTKHFCDAFMPHLNFSLLLNQYQPWEGLTYSWLDGKKAGINSIVKRLSRGENLWIYATSAEFAEKLHIALNETGKLDGLKVLAAYPNKVGEESTELMAAKNDNSKFKLYNVVIGSPAGGVGLSVEGEHFHATIGFMVQDKRTPDAVSSIQYPFRARDLINKHIDLVHIDQSGHGSPASKMENSRDAKILKQMKDVIISSAMPDEDRAKLMKLTSMLHIEYELKIDNQTAEDFPKYRQIITDEFKAKGIQLVGAEDSEEAIDVQESIKDASAAMEEKRTQALIEAPLIDEEQADKISGLLLRGRNTVSNADYLSLKKHRLLKAYHFDDGAPTSMQLHEYMELQKSGIATGRNSIARALLSYADIKRIQIAYVAGAGEEELFKRDIASSQCVKIKALWKVDKILSSLVGIARDGDEFTIDAPEEITLDMLKMKGGVNKATSFLSALSAAADEYNAMKPEKRISRHNLNKDPVGEIRGLLASRFKISTTKVRGVDAFTIDDDQPVISNINSQMELGSFGDLKVLDRIHAIEMLLDGKDLSSDARQELGFTLDNERFLKKGLSMLTRKKQRAVLPEYLRRAAMPKKEGDNFTSLAKANLYLLDVCGVSDLAA